MAGRLDRVRDHENGLTAAVDLLKQAQQLKNSIFGAVFGYLRAQLVLMCITFCEIYLAFTLFGVEYAVLLALITWSDENMAGCCFGGEKKQPFTLAGPHMANVLSFEEPTAPLTVGTIDEFIEYYLERHPEGRVDYVHDEPAVRALCKKGAVAFLMPPFAKGDLFKGVVMGGVLPRKTFSMGHAEEKRYYIECRKITE